MQRAPKGNGERGVVLILALIALLIIAAVAATMIYMATAETSLVTSQKAAARSFYSAMGGLEETRYRMIPGLNAAQGAINNFDALNPLNNTQPFARVPALPPIGLPPSEILYVINVPNPAPPTNVSVPGSIPTAAQDPLRVAEVPNAATFRGVASIQQSSGTLNSLDWQWVRVNLKTELASRQDLNLDGLLDQQPVFLFQGRQYRGGDLLNYDLDGPALTAGPGDILPFPWGCNPLTPGVGVRPSNGTPCPGGPPVLDRNCVAVICATAVYMMTARGNVAVGGAGAARLTRAEVGQPMAFSINAGILSQPGIAVNGQMFASGRDICDPDCSKYPDGTNYPFPSWPPGFTPAAENDPTKGVPAACSYVIPVKSESPAPSQAVNNLGARTDPTCSPAVNPNCVCKFQGGVPQSCVLAGEPPIFDVNQMISLLRPLARTLQNPVNSYYPQLGTSNLNCDATGCQGQSLELGGFPFADPVAQSGPDPVNGLGAEPVITYVPGSLKCTSSCTGAGILIVDGDLELSASMAFYGVVIVRGNVSVTGGGAPPTPCNIYGGLVSTGGVSTDLGGSICFQYNTCAQRNSTYFAPLTGLSFREVPQ